MVSIGPAAPNDTNTDIAVPRQVHPPYIKSKKDKSVPLQACGGPEGSRG